MLDPTYLNLLGMQAQDPTQEAQGAMPTIASTSAQGIAAPDPLSYEEMMAQISDKLNKPSAVEDQIQKRLLYTPDQRAKDKLREMLGWQEQKKDFFGNVTQKGDPWWKKVLMGLSETSQALAKGPHYVNPVTRARDAANEEYKTETGALNRELSVEAANKRAEANASLVAWGRKNQQDRIQTEAAYKSGQLRHLKQMENLRDEQNQIQRDLVDPKIDLMKRESLLKQAQANEAEYRLRIAQQLGEAGGIKTEPQMAMYLAQLEKVDSARAKRVQAEFAQMQAAKAAAHPTESSHITNNEGLPATRIGGTYYDPTTRQPMNAPGGAPGAPQMYPALGGEQKTRADLSAAAFKAGQELDEMIQKLETKKKFGLLKGRNVLAVLDPKLAFAGITDPDITNFVSKVDSYAKLVQGGVHSKGQVNAKLAKDINDKILVGLLSGPAALRGTLKGYQTSATNVLKGIRGIEPYLKQTHNISMDDLELDGIMMESPDGKTRRRVPANRVKELEQQGARRVKN